MASRAAMSGDLLVMLKVAERCNIHCSYCYMYNGVDQGWRARPKFLDDAALDQLTRRLLEHRAAHPHARMTVEIHGGEPLLLGKPRTDRFLRGLRQVLPRRDLFIVTQSNGVLVDREWLDLYGEHEATLAISCDGPPAMQDRHRPDFRGRGTGEAVESDGSYRLLDVLAICEDGASVTALNVHQHSLAQFVAHAQGRYPPACDTCRRCEAFTACGGGYLPHRFDGNSYDNPSFYCEVLKPFHRHVAQRVGHHTAPLRNH